MRYVATDFADDAGGGRGRRGARRARRGARNRRATASTTSPCRRPPSRRSSSELGERRSTRGLDAADRREAVRPRPRLGARAERDPAALASPRSEIFRIDHYLGKETVQNMLALRFANGIFEPIWNRQFIDHVQITVAESIGIEGRAAFYEQAGAIRDIFQNHLLQLVALTAMEPPIDFTADSVRNEKVKVLRVAAHARAEVRRARPVRARLRRGRGGARVPRGGRRRDRTRRPRRSSRRSSTSTTGAGPTRRSTSAPASGWRGARRRSRSSSSGRRTRRSPRSPATGCGRTCS